MVSADLCFAVISQYEGYPARSLAEMATCWHFFLFLLIHGFLIVSLTSGALYPAQISTLMR